MTLDETRETIGRFSCGMSPFDNRDFLEWWNDQEAEQERIVAGLGPDDLDNFFLLLDEEGYGPDTAKAVSAGSIARFGFEAAKAAHDAWINEILAWLIVWIRVHPKTVRDKVARLAHDLERWKQVVYLIGDVQELDWLSTLEKVADEAFAMNRLDEDLAVLIERSLDSIASCVTADKSPLSVVMEGVAMEEGTGQVIRLSGYTPAPPPV